MTVLRDACRPVKQDFYCTNNCTIIAAYLYSFDELFGRFSLLLDNNEQHFHSNWKVENERSHSAPSSDHLVLSGQV